MGLFEKVGRRVERFKQRASDAATAEADYECSACGERLYADAETCPECGAAAVEALAPEGTETETEAESDADDGAGADAEGDGDAAASTDPE